LSEPWGIGKKTSRLIKNCKVVTGIKLFVIWEKRKRVEIEDEDDDEHEDESSISERFPLCPRRPVEL